MYETPRNPQFTVKTRGKIYRMAIVWPNLSSVSISLSRLGRYLFPASVSPSMICQCSMHTSPYLSESINQAITKTPFSIRWGAGRGPVIVWSELLQPLPSTNTAIPLIITERVITNTPMQSLNSIKLTFNPVILSIEQQLQSTGRT